MKDKTWDEEFPHRESYDAKQMTKEFRGRLLGSQAEAPTRRLKAGPYKPWCETHQQAPPCTVCDYEEVGAAEAPKPDLATEFDRLKAQKDAILARQSKCANCEELQAAIDAINARVAPGVEAWRSGHSDGKNSLPDYGELVEYLVKCLDVQSAAAREARVRLAAAPSDEELIAERDQEWGLALAEIDVAALASSKRHGKISVEFAAPSDEQIRKIAAEINTLHNLDDDYDADVIEIIKRHLAKVGEE